MLKIQEIKAIKIQKFIKELKNSFFYGQISLKTLLKDTFSKKVASKDKLVRHTGDKFDHTPEFILKDGDTDGIIVKTAKFYPEDIKKMEKMSLEERILYKGKLKEEGRYIYEEND